QASAIQRQLAKVFEGGSAGAFVFSWTDEWSRSGAAILDWGFGLTDQHRAAKPALAAVADAFAQVPFAPRQWPSMSVVVCTHNGSRTLRACLNGLSRLEYPGEHELIVVDDGSTDQTPSIIREYQNLRLIRTPPRGLSNARNT